MCVTTLFQRPHIDYADVCVTAALIFFGQVSGHEGLHL